MDGILKKQFLTSLPLAIHYYSLQHIFKKMKFKKLLESEDALVVPSSWSKYLDSIT